MERDASCGTQELPAPVESGGSVEWAARQWQLICAEAPLCMAVFDRGMRYLAVSRRWSEALESSRAGLAGLAYAAVHPQAARRWEDVHRQALSGVAWHSDQEHRILDDGEESWGRWTWTPWRLPDGQIGGLIATLEITTAEHRARRELQTTGLELHLALEAARAGTWEADLATGKNKWSDEIWDLYGLRRGEAEPSTETWRGTVAAAQREQVVDQVMAAVAAGEGFEIEWQVELAHEERWLFCRGRPIFEPDGRAERYIGVVIDITARKQAEQAAAERERKLRTLLDAIPVGISHADRTLRYTFSNRCHERFFGTPAGGLAGRPVEEVIGKQAMARAMPNVRQVLAGHSVSFENTVPFADGHPHALRVSLVPEIDANAQVQGYYAVSLDLTEKRQLDSELAQMRRRLIELTRREVAQQTIVAVAHELSQPLHAAAAFVEAARMMLSQEKPIESITHAVARTAEEVQRAKRVLRELFAFVRGTRSVAQGAMAPMDLNELVSRALEAWRTERRCKPACLSWQPAERPLTVAADSAAIEKVIGNLLGNACEAVGCGQPGAQITVRTLEKAGQALVGVEDSGGGVNPTMRPHLFEPLHSTKPDGLGLGLAVSRQLVELHGGTIWYEARPVGSAFWLALPLAP